MADEVDMDLELSVDAGVSSSSSLLSKQNSPKSPMLQSKWSRYEVERSTQVQTENEKEEGELESDASSISDPSPPRKVQLSSGGLFSQKVYERQTEFSGSIESSVKEKENMDDVDISLDVSGKESSHSDDDLDYHEVKEVSSSDEEISSEHEIDGITGGSKDSDQLAQVSSNSESSDFNEDQNDSELDKIREDIVNISESEKETSEVDDSDEMEEQESSHHGLSMTNKTESRQLAKSGSGSESDTRKVMLLADDSRSNSTQFKKSKQNRDKDSSSKTEKTGQKYNDNEAESYIDHLQIAAPQQTAVLEAKKKSSKDRLRRDRSSSKEDKERKKSRDKRRDGKERERHDLDRHDKKHRKYEENRYEKSVKKKEKEADRIKSSVEKKRTHSLMEEDLRRRLLQKRSTRDEVLSKQEKEPHDYKEKYRKEDKYAKTEKMEKRKDTPSMKLQKEERDKFEDLAGKKSKNASKINKDANDYRKDKDKSSTRSGNNEKSKKRPRQKLKSTTKRDKGKYDSESSESEDKEDKNSKTPSAKRPRSAEQGTDISKKVDNAAEQELDSDKESPNAYNYDDISSISSDELSPPPSPIELKKPTYYPAIMGCRDVKEFQWLNKIEEGTYGVVYRARDIRTDEVVALKRLKMEKEKEGFPITSLREINTLLKAQHPNIVTVREIVVGSNMDKIYIVMDYVEHDLKSLMETMTQPFLVGEVKTLMIQLLRGVQHMHDNWILHRDIKASNLLLSHKGILKIGDFGLAREYGSPLKHYTSIVVTLWYRAPELLLGAKEYKTAIDLWSVGCVFAELLTMKPLFPGKSEIDQINRIFKELGTPNDNIWPGPPAYSEYPMVKKTSFANHPYNILRQKFGANLTDKGFNLLNRLLTYDPTKRITAEDALKHDFFEESPLPIDPSMFPTWPAKSELGHRAIRKHNASPKAPEGGEAASKLANDDSNFGFHMPSATKGFSAKGVGFNLKF